MSLRVRLSLAFVFVVLAPLLIGGLIIARGVPGATASRIGDRAQVSARGSAQVLSQLCEQARLAASSLAYDAARTDAISANAKAAVAHAVAVPVVDYAAVVGTDGVPIESSGKLPQQVESAAQAPLPLGSCSGTTQGSPYVLAAQVPLLDHRGRPAGTAVVAIDVDTQLLSLLSPVQGAAVTLARGGMLVTSSLGQPDEARRVAAAAPAIVSSGKPQQVGDLTVAAVGPDQGRPLTVLVSMSSIVSSNMGSELAAVSVSAVVLALVIGWQLARMTTRPLRDLALAAERVAAGDLDTPVPPTRAGGEIGQLSEAFVDMTDELRTYIGQLEASRDELRRNVSRLGDTLSSTHDLGRILRVILETAVVSVGAEAGALFMAAPGRGELYLRVGQGLADRGVASGARLRIGDGVVGLVASSGNARHGRVGTAPGDLVLSEDEPQARRLMAVPLKAQGRVTGVLGLYDRADGADFDERDLDTIRTFASQATVAIDNVLLHQEAQRLSITDGLTGLWNYRYFTMNFAKEIERASRFGRPLALLLLDLDKFKDVNDAHGHQRGDSVLIELATRVKAEIREVDTLARYGGEEFVLVLPETDPEGAGQAAERICEVVRHRPFGQEGEDPLRITVSVGVAVFPRHGSTAATLIRSSDAALYAAKDAGRDGWRLAEEPAAHE